MVEEIEKRVEGILAKIAQYAPWLFAVTIVITVVLAGWKNSSPPRMAYPPDTRMVEYWKTEARLRIEIDRNLKQTAELLARLSSEMDAENYDAQALLAQIRDKRLELQKLTEDLLEVHRKMAVAGGGEYEKRMQVLNEG